MALRIYNSLTNRKENFKPIRKGRIGIYACGPTVYDEPHIGHARAAFTFDMITKYLRFKGYKVRYIRNITDVDDKIIDKARSQSTENRVQSTDLKKAAKEIAERYLIRYKEDMRALGISDADKEPRATAHIKDMIKVVNALIEKGHAYLSGGDVYFDVASFNDYGKLSHQDIAEMQPSEGKAVQAKRSPLDFALWKGAKSDEPSWKSPWGEGRPGWHIECSTMSMKYLGETIDIHGGGRDLIFPHHENEVAQSESLTGKRFANFWVHNGLLTIDGEKMSKSLGNFTSLKDVLRRYHPEVIRFFFASAHYASPIDYSGRRIEECKRALERFSILFGKINHLAQSAKCQAQSGGKRRGKTKGVEEFDREVADLEKKFEEAMDDDFNTPLALASLFEMVNISNKLIDDEDIEHNAKSRSLEGYVKTIRRLGNVLGLFYREKRDAAREDREMDDRLIELLVSVRDELRDKKEFELADKIRKSLKDIGVILEDSGGGSTWRRV